MWRFNLVKLGTGSYFLGEAFDGFDWMACFRAKLPRTPMEKSIKRVWCSSPSSDKPLRLLGNSTIAIGIKDGKREYRGLVFTLLTDDVLPSIRWYVTAFLGLALHLTSSLRFTFQQQEA